MKYKSYHAAKWRTYQARIQRIERHKHLMRRLPFLVMISGCAFAVLTLIFLIGFWIFSHPQPHTHHAAPLDKQPTESAQTAPDQLLEHLRSDASHLFLFDDQFILEKDDHRFILNTTIKAKLQNYIDQLLQRSRSLQAAVVVLNPLDGRVLAMASYDRNDSPVNLCLIADYPAASLFKIISAAAAIETAGFHPDKAFYFNGSRHTLYKNQLKQTRNRYSTPTKFRKAFARSNNPVFGKVGIHTLGQHVMTEYAQKFYFNRAIPFDFPVAVSRINVPDDEFGLAEIASGFNKKTLISPLHAALLACALAHSGSLVQPWLVDKICRASGEVIYQASQHTLDAPISPKTANMLKMMMKDAVIYGTVRKSFRKLRRQRLFKNFDLGAKTGTINDPTDSFKYDWFAGYAFPPEGEMGICISVLSVHGEILGTRSTELARAIIDYHFRSK
jgi:cell division protein FtsI/penicillin-binding protein 2